MGYVGPVTSVWIWRPNFATLTETWRTLVTEFETGAEQRRNKWNFSRASLKYQFDRGTLTIDEVQDIWRFYMRQKGAYGTFLAPAYGSILTRTTSTYIGSLSIAVEQTQDFTSEPASHWNRIYLEDPTGNYGYFQISSVNNDGVTLQVHSGMTTMSFMVGAWVCPVIRGRFTDDSYNIDFMYAMLTTTGLNVTEVRS